jgi:hypothetical protein
MRDTLPRFGISFLPFLVGLSFPVGVYPGPRPVATTEDLLRGQIAEEGLLILPRELGANSHVHHDSSGSSGRNCHGRLMAAGAVLHEYFFPALLPAVAYGRSRRLLFGVRLCSGVKFHPAQPHARGESRDNKGDAIG